MPYPHYPGYAESREKVKAYTDKQLLDLLDALYGRDNLEYGATHEDLLAEALRQHDEEWTDTASEEYKRAEFWRKHARLMRAGL